MIISIPTKPYNHYVLSRPWIGKLSFRVDGFHDVIEWGSFLGQPGYAGMLTLEAEPGDIVGYGQKNWKSPRESYVHYFRVSDTNALIPLDDREMAFSFSLIPSICKESIHNERGDRQTNS